jgi:hypothetical protein
MTILRKVFNESAKYTNNQIDEAVRKSLTPSRLSTYLPVATPYTTPTLAANTPTKLLIPTTVKKKQDFTLDVPNTRWFLDTTGVTDREFVITMTTSMIASANNNNVIVSMYKNGVFEEGVSIARKIGTGADQGAVSVTGSFMLSDNDYVEVYVETDQGGTITFSRTAINILEVN